MTIENCINGRVATGELTQQQAADAIAYIQKRRADRGYAAGSPEEAADLAVIASRIKEAARSSRRRTAQNAMKQIQATNWVTQQPTGFFGSSPESRAFAGAASVFVPDRTGASSHKSVEGMSMAYQHTLHGMFDAGISAMRSKVAGVVRQTTNMRDFIDEMFGGNSGNVAARAAASAWQETTDWAVARWKSFGGKLDRNQAWRVPQAHDPLLLRRAGLQKWGDDVRALEAQGGVQFIDWQTGGAVTPQRRDEILSEMYESVTTEGRSKIVPGENTQAAFVNSRSERRAIEFLTADAWRGYHNAYGPGEAQTFDMLTGWMDGMANDLALIDVLGTRPAHTARVVVDTARKAGVSDAGAHILESVYQQVSGEVSAPVSDTLARVGGETRAFLGAAQLGSALLSSAGDFVTAALTARFNGLPIMGTMGRYLSLMNPANAADRELAHRMLLGAEAQTRRFSDAARSHLDMSRGIGQKLGDAVMRASLLASHSEQLEHAFGWEMISALTGDRIHAFGAMDPRRQAFLERYGITSAEWDAMRASPLNAGGLPILDPRWMIKQGGAAAEGALKLAQAIAVEQRFAVPAPGQFERALLYGQSRPGTIGGELRRSIMQYKGFSVSILSTHILRGLAEARRNGRYWYLPGFFIGTTLMGALSMQLKALANGRDVQEPDGKFWAAAAIQGGGFGIMGDFMFNSVNRAGKDVLTTLAGPTFGLAADTLSLVPGNVGEALREKDTNIGREAAQFLKRYTPGSSLWYARLAMERWVWNSLQEWADPRYQESFRRTESNLFRDTGQRYWWRPGATEPSRPPAGP